MTNNEQINRYLTRTYLSKNKDGLLAGMLLMGWIN